MTLEAETSAQSLAGWRGRSLAWLAYVDNISVARFSESTHAAAESVNVPRWPRARIGRIAYFAAVTGFLILTVALKDAPGPGWMLILTLYAFLGLLAICVSLPRSAD